MYFFVVIKQLCLTSGFLAERGRCDLETVLTLFYVMEDAMEFRWATKIDLKLVLEWQKAERKLGLKPNFWGNRRLITRACAKKEMWVLISDGNPIAFLVGNIKYPSIDILAVKCELRGKGCGSYFVNCFMNEIIKNNSSCVLVSVQFLTESLGFWKKKFEPYSEVFDTSRDTQYDKLAFRILNKTNELPTDVELDQSLNISFFSEEYKNHSSPFMLKEFDVQGYKNSDNSIILKDRLIFHHPKVFVGRDIMVRIILNEKLIFLDQAKYSERSGLVVHNNGLFSLDEILPS